MKYDIITIGTATRDVFLTSPLFKVLTDVAHLKKIGFPTGEAQCFALGGKVEIDAPVLTTGGGATNAAVTFGRQGFKAACLAKIGDDAIAGDVEAELVKEGVKTILEAIGGKEHRFFNDSSRAFRRADDFGLSGRFGRSSKIGLRRASKNQKPLGLLRPRGNQI